jgi:arylsulfatase A
MTMDLFPTFAKLAGVTQFESRTIDGTDLTPLLLDDTAPPERMVFWRMNDEKAVRHGPWKLCLIGKSPPALYNLNSDLGKTIDLSSKRPDLVRSLTEAWHRWEESVSPNDN